MSSSPSDRGTSIRPSSDEPGVSYTCQLDRKAASPCMSLWRHKVKKTSKHTFSVWATDAAGNVDATPATWTWRIKVRRR